MHKNNQINISKAKISSLIINITDKKYGYATKYTPGINRNDGYACIPTTKNARRDALIGIVSNINNIIDIQFNKLGHKSILVRDAGTKKIQKMKLHKFVDYIRDECKKVGINEAEIKKINPDFPTSKEVHKKTQGFWCKIKSFFGFNHHDHNNAYASYDTDVIKNGIDTLVHSNM